MFYQTNFMTIETKYNCGDFVYVLDDNKIMCRQIIVVDVWANREKVTIEYKMATLDMHKNCREIYPEDKCFSKKEELLQSL